VKLTEDSADKAASGGCVTRLVRWFSSLAGFKGRIGHHPTASPADQNREIEPQLYPHDKQLVQQFAEELLLEMSKKDSGTLSVLWKRTPYMTVLVSGSPSSSAISDIVT
jgi:hypothetical protein